MFWFNYYESITFEIQVAFFIKFWLSKSRKIGENREWQGKVQAIIPLQWTQKEGLVSAG